MPRWKNIGGIIGVKKFSFIFPDWCILRDQKGVRMETKILWKLRFCRLWGFEFSPYMLHRRKSDEEKQSIDEDSHRFAHKKFKFLLNNLIPHKKSRQRNLTKIKFELRKSSTQFQLSLSSRKRQNYTIMTKIKLNWRYFLIKLEIEDSTLHLLAVVCYLNWIICACNSCAKSRSSKLF